MKEILGLQDYKDTHCSDEDQELDEKEIKKQTNSKL